MSIDYNGLSAVIPATVAGVVALGTFAMQVVNWLDQRKIKRSLEEARIAADTRDAKLTNLQTSVTAALADPGPISSGNS